MRSPRAVLSILAACGAACGSSGEITVAGRLSPPLGSGAQVVIQGRVATPDATTGAFSIAGVRAPYDLVVILPGAAQKTGVVYRGLRRVDPTIHTFAAGQANPYSASISGTVTGGLVPPLQLTRTHVTFGSPEAKLDAEAAVGANITYALAPTWAGATSTTGTLHALQWNATGPADERPAAYTGYGEKAGVTIATGGSFAGQDLALAPVTSTSHVTGTVSVPAGYGSDVEIDGGLIYVDGSSVTLFSQAGQAGAFDFLVPSLAGATARVAATKVLPSTARVIAIRPDVALDASGVTLAVQSAPEAVAPADAATGVTTATSFSWSPFANGVHVVFFGAGPAQPSFYVVTAAASGNLPDLSAYGLALPKNANYLWMVEAFAPLASVDELADPGSFLNGDEGQAPPGGVVHLGVSQVRSFTTAP